MTYHPMFLEVMKSSDIEGVCKLYEKMMERNFVPDEVYLQKYQVGFGFGFVKIFDYGRVFPQGNALELLMTVLYANRSSLF